MELRVTELMGWPKHGFAKTFMDLVSEEHASEEDFLGTKGREKIPPTS